MGEPKGGRQPQGLPKIGSLDAGGKAVAKPWIRDYYHDNAMKFSLGESFNTSLLAIKLAGGKDFAVVARRKDSGVVKRVRIQMGPDRVLIGGSVKRRTGITYEAITRSWEPVPNHLALWTNLISLPKIAFEAIGWE